MEGSSQEILSGRKDQKIVLQVGIPCVMKDSTWEFPFRLKDDSGQKCLSRWRVLGSNSFAVDDSRYCNQKFRSEMEDSRQEYMCTLQITFQITCQSTFQSTFQRTFQMIHCMFQITCQSPIQSKFQITCQIICQNTYSRYMPDYITPIYSAAS